jgi:signal transduction histidine kinase
VKKSRNQYHTRVNEVKEHAHTLQETRVLLKMTHSLQRYSKVDTKRERANLNRQELSEYLAKQVDDKLMRAEAGRRGVENHR